MNSISIILQVYAALFVVSIILYNFLMFLALVLSNLIHTNRNLPCQKNLEKPRYCYCIHLSFKYILLILYPQMLANWASDRSLSDLSKEELLTLYTEQTQRYDSKLKLIIDSFNKTYVRNQKNNQKSVV